MTYSIVSITFQMKKLIIREQVDPIHPNLPFPYFFYFLLYNFISTEIKLAHMEHSYNFTLLIICHINDTYH